MEKDTRRTPQWTVEKHPHKRGYRLRSNVRLSYLYDGFTCCWYKFKQDAVERAESLNRALISQLEGKS